MRAGLLAGAGLVALLATGAAGQAAAPKDQLIVGMTLANVLQMDPQDNSAYEKSHFMIQLYDRLLEMRADDDTKLEPLLAQSWSFEPNGDVLFRLRENAVFHGGRKVTAEDVAWSLQRPLLAALNGGNDYREVGFTPENVTKLITVEDEHTVRVARPGKLNLVIFMYGVLAHPAGSIVDKKILEENTKNNDYGADYLKTREAGGGRFKLNRFTPNEIAILDRVDEHWSGKSAMRRIVVRHIPEAQAQRLQIERGDIDLAYTLNVSDYAALDANPDVDVQKVVGDGYYHIALSTKNPILANPDVRRALRYLVPYDGLQKSVMTYFGEPWHQPIARGRLGDVPDLNVTYDVAKAKELLAKAGHPDGFEAEILTLSQPPFAEIATAFQEGAAAAGVKIKVTQGNGTVVYGQMRKRTYDMVVGRALGGRYGDPHSNVANSMYNPDNGESSALQNYAWRTSFQDAQLDQMIETAAAEQDQGKRIGLYRDIEARYEELGPPFILIGQRIDPFAIRAGVKGIVGHPAWTTRWDLATKD